MFLPAFACFVQASDERRLRAIAAFDDARFAMQKWRGFGLDHLHLHFAALEQFVEALVSGPVHHTVDLVEALVPLFFECCFAGEPGSRDVPRVEIAIADNLDEVDALDLLIHQLKDGGAEVTGDAPVGPGASQTVFQENMAQTAGAGAEAAKHLRWRGHPRRSFLMRVKRMRAACASSWRMASRLSAMMEAKAIRSSRRVR